MGAAAIGVYCAAVLEEMASRSYARRADLEARRIEAAAEAARACTALAGRWVRIRLRPKHRNHAWSWDFVMAPAEDGRAIKILTLIHGCTRESLAIFPARHIRVPDVIELLADVLINRGIPEHRRSPNQPEMVARS